MSYLTYKTEGNNKYTVFWEHELNGGGMSFGSEYPSMIKYLHPNRVFENCLEWCSGPGFIGYNLLDHGICKKLTLTDIYQPAIDIANESATFNDLQDKVKGYCTGEISKLPNELKFDLVVGNPPHYDRPYYDPSSRIANDPSWKIHKQFYANIVNYLTDDGIILLQENEDGSNIDCFFDMIKDAGLRVKSVVKSMGHYTISPNLIYYIETHK